ncbi:MAG: radical SAM protein [Candidatus Riflebacteria bacterium]|nr:radical SAM protein [Candidatus Riflebacteria bacterium]
MSIEKPARYIGGEWNQTPIKEQADLNICLAFPDLYELGMSNIALKILYEILNKDPKIFAERVFSPWVDFSNLLRKKEIPLFSLESKRPLNQFHLLGITLPYEMTFTNVLELLDLGKIPVLAKERNGFPLVIAGGPSAINPMTISPFFDAILIGDGEEALYEICKITLSAKNSSCSRKEILKEIAEVEGFFVPDFPRPVRRRIFLGFPNFPPPIKPIVSHIESIHDRSPLEIFRGCIQGCRFCNAGFFYRPKRERPPEELTNWALKITENTGDEALGLVSLSTSDYSNLKKLVNNLESRLPYPDSSLNLPSLRMNDKTLELMKVTQKIKKSGLTFAPEAGTQRLRNIIGKNITEEEILKVIEGTRETCFRNVKLYFMIGLPFETDEDLDGIGNLMEKILAFNRRLKLKKEFSISISPFVPKPFTPFQWAPQISGKELERRRHIVLKSLKKIGIKTSWREEFLCSLEAIMARGDEKVGKLIYAAYNRGCHFDAWNEHFKPNKWQEALAECNLSIEEYTRERNFEEKLPWDFIDYRVPRKYFEDEYKRAEKLASEKHG